MTTPITATLTCPQCSHQQKAEIPQTGCQVFYKCEGCGKMISPKEGDCCVFCSFGDRKCPLMEGK